MSDGAAAAAGVRWRDYAGPVAVLIGVTAVGWWWIAAMARDMYGAMTGPSAWMMTPIWDGEHLVLLWLMWAVMMAAMMLPSAWPMLTVYAALSRRTPSASTPVHLYPFAAGYLAVWAAFSAAATVAQRMLAALLLLSPMMELTSRRASAVFLLAAGLYQFTPLKRVCLGACRSPIGFLIGRWRPGPRGAFLMGVDHGVYCVGCCWALMLLLFVGGVMNLYVIAALTAMVALEKVGRAGELGSRVAGGVLIVLAVWLALN